MQVRRWILAGTTLATATFGGTALLAPAAFAATEGGSGSGGPSVTFPITGSKYDFCIDDSCPSVWTVDYSNGKFKDNEHDKGTFTHSGKNYTFFFPSVEGTSTSCTFLGSKTATGFNSAAKPGTYTCSDGASNTWYATAI